MNNFSISRMRYDFSNIPTNNYISYDEDEDEEDDDESYRRRMRERIYDEDDDDYFIGKNNL